MFCHLACPTPYPHPIPNLTPTPPSTLCRGSGARERGWVRCLTLPQFGEWCVFFAPGNGSQYFLGQLWPIGIVFFHSYLTNKIRCQNSESCTCKIWKQFIWFLLSYCHPWANKPLIPSTVHGLARGVRGGRLVIPALPNPSMNLCTSNEHVTECETLSCPEERRQINKSWFKNS